MAGLPYGHVPFTFIAQQPGIDKEVLRGMLLGTVGSPIRINEAWSLLEKPTVKQGRKTWTEAGEAEVGCG